MRGGRSAAAPCKAHRASGRSRQQQRCSGQEGMQAGSARACHVGMTELAARGTTHRRVCGAGKHAAVEPAANAVHRQRQQAVASLVTTCGARHKLWACGCMGMRAAAALAYGRRGAGPGTAAHVAPGPGGAPKRAACGVAGAAGGGALCVGPRGGGGSGRPANWIRRAGARVPSAPAGRQAGGQARQGRQAGGRQKQRQRGEHARQGNFCKTAAPGVPR